MRMTKLRFATWNTLMMVAACLCLCGCSHIPGRPGPGPEVVRPEQILNFAILYKANCAACHGANGKDGAAISLANPVYLAVAGEENLRQIISKGVSGKLMPAFAKDSGGVLTSQQIDVIAHGLIEQWGKPDLFVGQGVPAYAATEAGDALRGQQAFTTFCARCHGSDGKGIAGSNGNETGKAGSIVDGSYLALISDQGLRSIVIAGRPDEGMPDWRSDSSQSMSDGQITDIVAWLASKRVVTPGQPYPTHP